MKNKIISNQPTELVKFLQTKNPNTDQIIEALKLSYKFDQDERKLREKWEENYWNIDQITKLVLKYILDNNEINRNEKVTVSLNHKTEEIALHEILRIITQHQDRDVSFQQYILKKYKNIFLWREEWYLVDRIKINTYQKQIYGTQWTTLNYTSKWVPEKFNARYMQPIEGIIWIDSWIKWIVYLTDDEIKELNGRRLNRWMESIEDAFEWWRKKWYTKNIRPRMIKDYQSYNQYAKENWLITIPVNQFERTIEKILKKIWI